MNLRTTAMTLSVGMLLGLAGQAFAMSVSAASGPITVNGKSVTIVKGKPLALKAGDVVAAGSSTVTFTATSGDTIRLERNGIAEAMGDDGRRDSLYLREGVGIGTLSEKTTFGAAPGWVTVPAGAKAKSQVFIEVPAAKKGSEALYRTNSGEAWVQYHSFQVGLTTKHAVTLNTDNKRPGLVCYRTHQQNRGTVIVKKRVQGGMIISEVPRATSGCSEPQGGNSKTKISNDISSFKTGKIKIETDFGEGKGHPAELGPGTYAIIDNATGAITVVFTAVEFDILDRAVSLTTEFATLTQSNFADVGKKKPGGGGSSNSNNNDQ